MKGTGQTVLNGEVLVLNSGKKPLSGVEIRIKGDDRFEYTDSDGKFKIVLSNKSKGDYISIEANLGGYVVVNEHDLTEFGVNPEKKVIIEMCDPNVLRKRRDEFYSVNLQGLLASYQKEIKEQKEQKETLRARLDNALRELDSLSEWYATHNIDFAGEYEKEYILLLQEGKIDLILNGDIRKRLSNEIRNLSKVRNSGIKATERIDRELHTLESIAQLALISGEISKFKEVYTEIIKLDENKFYWIFKYAGKLQTLLDLDNSINMYELGLNNSINNPDSIRSILSIAYIYNAINKRTLSKNYFLKAEKIDKQLNIGYSINIAKGLVSIYRNQTKYDSADYYCNKTLTLLNLNSNNKDFRKFAARAYSELGDYFSSRYLFYESDRFYKNADSTYNTIFLKDGDDPNHIIEMKREYAQFLGTTGNYYLKRKRMAESESCFTKSDSILTQLILNKDVLAINALLFNWFEKSTNTLLQGDTTNSKFVYAKIDSLNKTLNGEIVTVVAGIQNVLTSLTGYITSSKDSAVFTLSDLSVTMFEKYGASILPIIQKLAINKKYQTTLQDSVNQVYELNNITVLLIDSLGKTDLIKKDELSQSLLMLSNAWFDLGDQKKGFACLAKSYSIGKEISENDKKGFTYYPELGNIYSLSAYRFIQIENINASIWGIDSAIIIYEKLASIDTFQFACELAEAYLQKANLLELAQSNIFDNEGWYNYLVSNSINFSVEKAEKWTKYCHNNLMNQSAILNYRCLVAKAHSILWNAYSTGNLSLESRKHLNSVITDVKNFNIIGDNFFDPLNDIVQIENMLNAATDQFFQIGQVYYKSQLYIDEANSIKDYNKKISLLVKADRMLNNAIRNHPEETNLIIRRATIYNNLSWNYLFLRKFNKANSCALNSLKLNHSELNLVPFTNLGHSYLFKSKYKKAIETYEKLKGKVAENGRQYKDILLEDFDVLENAGIGHPDLHKIKEIVLQW